MLLVLPVATQAEEMQILALGDSLTAGYGLPAEDGFVPQLQAWLEERGVEVTIQNGGVSGDTTAGGRARIEWSLAPEVDAMIVTLGGNDILRGIDPLVARDNLDAILDIADQRGLPVLLVGLYASQNFGADYKAMFDAIYPKLAEEHGTLLEPNFFQGLGDGVDPAAYRRFMQADGIHPNAEGVQRIVARIGPRVEELMQQVEAQ
ncbi:arylesterase [Pseudooceanicola sp. LIPI14-2-Ac024]|uniref:arylesterase n=1 Tax=Pseudooceanicola sp. LIPI14-2-Ac024 TaxID=3344875 RepID=UPI0035D07E4C